MQPRESQERPPFRRAFGDRPSGGGGRGFGDRQGQGGGGFRRSGGFSGPPGPPIDYRGLVEFVCKSVADKPDQAQVQAFERGAGTVALKIKMADEDLGRLIGKGGRNIEAIRTLVRVASLRERKRVFVDLATNR